MTFIQDIEPLARQFFAFLGSFTGRLLLCFVVLILATIINRLMHWRLLSRDHQNWEDTRLRAKWVRRRNVVWATAVIIIVALWSNQITGFLISLAAIGGALLIVSKELILCLWGGLIISLSKSLRIGNVVEIGDFTGQLVNTGFLTFDLMEIGPSRKQTGRLLQVPNALLLSQPLKNLSTYGMYGVHLIEFYFEPSVDLNIAEELILKLANNAASDWVEKADAHFKSVEKDRFVELPKAHPQVFWASINEKCIRMTLRFACRLSKRGQLEKQIVKGFWTEYYNLAKNHTQDNKQIT